MRSINYLVVAKVDLKGQNPFKKRLYSHLQSHTDTMKTKETKKQYYTGISEARYRCACFKVIISRNYDANERASAPGKYRQSIFKRGGTADGGFYTPLMSFDAHYRDRAKSVGVLTRVPNPSNIAVINLR